MSDSALFIIAGILLVVPFICGYIWEEKLRARRQERRALRDAALHLDHWTEERRLRLVDMQQPAAKGFDANRAMRHTVVGHKERPS